MPRMLHHQSGQGQLFLQLRVLLPVGLQTDLGIGNPTYNTLA